jgi:predicted RNA-binding Zn ribbon-like protein
MDHDPTMEEHLRGVTSFTVHEEGGRDRLMVRCQAPGCDRLFEARKRTRMYCSNACCQRAWQARKREGLHG